MKAGARKLISKIVLDYDARLRDFPPLPRAVAAVLAAIIVPTALYLCVAGMWIARPGDAGELALVLAIYVGQSAFIAIPLALIRWRRMPHPLLECVLLGAVLAPGPLGYFGLVMAFSWDVLSGVRLLFLLASLGAIGGFVGWAVATDIGTRPSKQGNT